MTKVNLKAMDAFDKVETIRGHRKVVLTADQEQVILKHWRRIKHRDFITLWEDQYGERRSENFFNSAFNRLCKEQQKNVPTT